MGLGILSPKGHPNDDPNLCVPGTHVLWKSEDTQQTDSDHIVLIPTVCFLNLFVARSELIDFSFSLLRILMIL